MNVIFIANCFGSVRFWYWFLRLVICFICFGFGMYRSSCFMMAVFKFFLFIFRMRRLILEKGILMEFRRIVVEVRKILY